MKVGDVVIPNPHSNTVLASGCGRYSCAICVSVEPFILVSIHTDMKWSCTVKEEDFVALCQAHPNIVEKCMERLSVEERSLSQE